LNEASKRAVIVAMQITSGKAGTGLSVAEFTNPSGYKFGVDTSYAAGEKTFSLTLSKDPSGDIDESICTQMIAATGTNSAMLVAPGCGTITFNADMSKGVSTGGTATADGWTEDDGSTCIADTKLGGTNSCQVCVQGLYVDSDAKCESGKVCVDGTCSPNPLSGSGCAKNSDCKDQTDSDGNDCGSNGCYCNYNRNLSCSGPTGKGICVAKTKDYGAEVTVDGHKYVASYYRSGNFDWWSAKNFCQAYGKRMMSLSELGCESGVNCMTEGTKFYAINSAVMNSGEEDVSGGVGTWTTTFYRGNSCTSWAVNGDGRVYNGYARNANLAVLCR